MCRLDHSLAYLVEWPSGNSSKQQWDDPFKNQEPAVIIDGVLMSVFLLLCVTIWCAHIIFVHNGLLG